MVLKAIYDFVVLLLKIIQAIIKEIVNNVPSLFFYLYVAFGIFMLHTKEPIDNGYLFLGLLILANYIRRIIEKKK